jgi:hypothetical protein
MILSEMGRLARANGWETTIEILLSHGASEEETLKGVQMGLLQRRIGLDRDVQSSLSATRQRGDWAANVALSICFGGLSDIA